MSALARTAGSALAALLVLAAVACSTTAGTTPRASSPGATPTGSTAGPRAASPATGPVTLSFAGDVHFEGVSRAALGGGLGPIAPLLGRADLTVVNLETAVTSRGTPAAGKEFTFRAPPTAFDALRAAGVDVVTMANNHGLDYGQVGLADSLSAARAAGMPVVGAGADEDAAFAPHTATVRGTRVAVIGATQVLDASVEAAWTAGPGRPGLASAKRVDRLVAAVAAARRAADVVAVDLHWGVEQDSCATVVQKDLAQRLAAAGADVVVGSHAHVLLGGGWLGSTYVDYGLGNFVFYARTAVTEASGVLTLTLDGRRTTAASWAPARITAGVPVPLSGAAAAAAAAAKDRLRGCTGLRATP